MNTKPIKQKEELTPTQKNIAMYVMTYIDENNYSPTYYEIAERMGISAQAVDAHLKLIVKKGWLKFNGKRNRKLSLVD